MAEATEPYQGQATGSDPSPPPDELTERLRRLEQAVTDLTRLQAQAAASAVPNGYTAVDATGFGGLVQAAITGALVPVTPYEVPGVGGFWNRFAFLRQIRLMFRMYVDPRYRLSRIGQFGVPLIIALGVLNYLTFYVLFPVVPVVTPVLERVVLAVLAVALYKVLSREAARYDAVLRYLAQFGRPFAGSPTT